MSDMQDSVWFITGASCGFEKAISRKVLKRGGRVVASARTASSLADLEPNSGHQLLTLQRAQISLRELSVPHELDATLVGSLRYFPSALD